MEIKFLGTGGAFDWQYGTSAATIRTKDKLFLIDCGRSVFPRLMELGLIDKFDYLLLTHLHGDHVGSIFEVLCQRGLLGLETPIIVPDDEFAKDIKALLDMFHYSRKQDIYIPISEIPEIGCINTYGQHVPDMKNYAYYFTEDNELIYYSGDIGRIETAVDFLKERTESKIRVFHETHHLEIPSHVNYKTVNQELKDYETYLYHTSPEKIPEDNTMPLVAEVPELNW